MFELYFNYLHMKQDTLHLLMEFFKIHSEVSYHELLTRFSDKNETTITRNLNFLLKSGKLTKKKIGKNTFYTYISSKNIKEYFDIPFFERPKVGYNPDFLRNYTPNETSFL
ncbi:hypothetical protein FACS189428_3770 [Clostridia bacterium]|nr:hypothetical protein FACS189428_3770 [Clostridia bacterium]